MSGRPERGKEIVLESVQDPRTLIWKCTLYLVMNNGYGVNILKRGSWREPLRNEGIENARDRGIPFTEVTKSVDLAQALRSRAKK